MIAPTDPRPLRGCPIAVLDFETTSVDAWTCEPVQVAIVHADLGDSEPRVAFQSLIRPPCLIPEEATAIHGITDAAVCDAPSMAEALPDLLAALESRALVAFNLPYDWRILSRFADVPFGSLCGYVLARAIDKYERGKRLVDVASRRGLDFSAHDAGGDALVTARLLPLLLRELGRGKERTDRYGRVRRDGPWCLPEDLRSVSALWDWTCTAGVEQEADLAAYLATQGKSMDSMPWHELTAATP